MADAFLAAAQQRHAGPITQGNALGIAQPAVA
jgi:hypothetical protein